MGAYAFRLWIEAPVAVHHVLDPHDRNLNILIRLRVAYMIQLFEKVP